MRDTPQGRGQTHTRTHTHAHRRRRRLRSSPNRRGHLQQQAVESTPRPPDLHRYRERLVWRLQARSATRPCVHEIRMSTWDSCCRAVTVKQIMSVGGNCNISLSRKHLTIKRGPVFQPSRYYYFNVHLVRPRWDNILRKRKMFSVGAGVLQERTHGCSSDFCS